VRLHEKPRTDIAEVQRLRLEKRVEGARDIRHVGADRDAGATESVRALDDDRIAVRPAEGIRGCRVVDDRKRRHSDTHRRRRRGNRVLSTLVSYCEESPSEYSISDDNRAASAGCMSRGGERRRFASSRKAMSSQGRTIRGCVAATISANAATHCATVAFSGRYPTRETKRLRSASEFGGVSNETVNPAWASAAGMRAVPIQRVAVETRRTGVFVILSS
jgi:hypothetical protein